MKKVGILTFHDAHNYGAMLQCYALQRFLQLEGFDVEVIDYRPPFYQDQYRRHKVFPYIGKNPWSTIRCLYYNVMLYNKRCDAFERFHHQYIKLSAPLTNNEIPADYDIYIIGSDQVWNPVLTKGFHDVFFCNFVFPKGLKRYISYAPSMEVKTLSKEEKEYIRISFTQFDAISVREASLIPVLQPLSEKPIVQVIDPTLLVDRNIWDAIEDKNLIGHPYVILYQVRESSEVRRRAKEFARQIGGEIVELTARIDRHYPTKWQCASPADFINLFRHADYVITTSFHGTAFSLIFNRPFYTFTLGDNFDSRSASLLESVGLTNRLVSVTAKIKMDKIDFNRPNELMSKQREFSISFLHNTIK